jgi:hypothetical protein
MATYRSIFYVAYTDYEVDQVIGQLIHKYFEHIKPTSTGNNYKALHKNLRMIFNEENGYTTKLLKAFRADAGLIFVLQRNPLNSFTINHYTIVVIKCDNLVLTDYPKRKRFNEYE